MSQNGWDVLEATESLSIALSKLDQNDVKVVFITDKGRLIGSLTNGDIRRGLERGATINSNLNEFANLEPIFLRPSATPLDVYRSFNNGVSFVPILSDKNEIIEVITQQSKKQIPISEPNISEREIELVTDTLLSNWVSSSGIYVDQFEEMFRKFTNANFSLSVSNGTQAIALALSALGIGIGDEVIVPAMTFGATANAVIQVGATPVFVDIETTSLGIDPDKLVSARTDKTKAIILVHLYGKPAMTNEVLSFAEKNHLFVIEDCAEALGTFIGSEHVGSRSDAGTFSFFANKTITTGEGGMVIFRDLKVFEKAKLIRSHGFDPKNRYWHITWGTNMRLTNMQAALGVGQMERLPEFLSRKAQISNTYTSIFDSPEFAEILKPTLQSRGTDSYWLHTIEFTPDIDVDEVVKFLANNRIESRRFFPPLPEQPAFKKYVHSGNVYANSKEKYDHSLCLPSSTKILDEEIRAVADVLRNFLSSRVKQD